ncbi:MAG: hypothetical protein COX90_00850 [Candidatus Nealsonbacteria bacterium CG_4_10_14_0_2_um_filter_38_17]|uniref:Uncharacterized protein n=1 Tax=Candidatus Nealsonbacteria bacterium CG_4_10_14_0_2_um_filter_38_17 TaxID=1974680 RepID=A0A2M7UZ71_9BACT|nr:MAG: hypothetical protein COX90_00850 [Candidatus Nealsonbacteria bacterium CG_4_10_14_0_2_um_filter_38_17]
MPQYTREQKWKLYEKLPQELKDSYGAEETGEAIYNACVENGVEEKLPQIVDFTGQVLLGLLPPEEFQDTLEKNLGLDRETAKKITHGINRFIFFPVKEVLNQLYGTEAVSMEKTEPISPAEIEEEPAVEEKPTKRKGPDTYREPLE